MEPVFRPLTDVISIVESAGFEISYMYEDIVFIDSNAFMFVFDDTNYNSLKIYFNTECEKTQIPDILENVSKYAKEKSLKIINSGSFSLQEKAESQELDILFYPN